MLNFFSYHDPKVAFGQDALFKNRPFHVFPYNSGYPWLLESMTSLQSCLYSVSSWDPICNPIFPILKKMQFVRQKLEIPINPWTPIMEQLITGQWRHQAIYLSMIARFPGFFLTKNRENPENRIAYHKYDIISRYSQNIDSIGVRARVGKRLHS